MKEKIKKKIEEEIKVWSISCDWDNLCPISPMYTKKKPDESIFEKGDTTTENTTTQPLLTVRNIDENKNKIECNLNIKAKNYEFIILYNETYGVERMEENNLRLETTEKELKEWVDEVNKLLNDEEWKEVMTISSLLTNAIMLYGKNHYKKTTKKNEDHQTEQMYRAIWGKHMKDIEKQIPKTHIVRKEIREALKVIQKEKDIRVRMGGENPFIWLVEMDFDKETELGQDLIDHAEKFQTFQEAVRMEIKFTVDYPEKAPIIRLLQPRMTYLTGNISFGGTFSQIQTYFEEEKTMNKLLRRLKEHLITEKARVDMNTSRGYDTYSAARAFVRDQHDEHYDTNAYEEQAMFAYSTDFANKLLHTETNPVEKGNRILLPIDVADAIFQQPDAVMPLMFEVTTPKTSIYVGVSQFTAPPKTAILPEWMMRMLFLKEGSKIKIRSVKLPKGTFATFQPHSKSFYKLKNHKRVLENALFHFSTLNEGTSIPIEYGHTKHLIEVVELKPSRAVSILSNDGVDLKIEFLPATDLEETDTLKSIQDDVESLTPLSALPNETIFDDGHIACDTCGRGIPAARLAMHQRHCERMYKKCHKCHHVIKIEHEANHEKKYHVMVTCDDCDVKLERYLLSKHKNEACVNRIVFCRYCDLPTSFQKLQQHEHSCGSQTIQCPHCESYVARKDQESHYCNQFISSLDENNVSIVEFTCPLCAFPNLDKNMMVQHVNACHQEDDTSVVCPICVASPHGDPEKHVDHFFHHLLTHHT